ncbi:MAG: dTMP kinase [Helicobacter sp.]|nr:dTMP kinase [Helicobacter sp.]
MYVALEGIDTSGKTTQIAALKRHFPNAICTKEPGGTELGAKLREILLERHVTKTTELFLFLADRAEHYARVIAPNADSLLISDRSLVSGIAYALAFDVEILCALNRLAMPRMPDLVIVLELDSASLQQRLSTKHRNMQADVLESRGIAYLLDVQQNMHRACELLELPYLTLCANENKETLTQKIVEAIRTRSVSSD